MQALIARLDHIYVPVEEPAYMLALFSERLDLPVAWPLTDYGPFRSGAVSLGNANLEFVADNTGHNGFLAAHLPATVRGIGFEPGLAAERWAADFASRRLSHSLPFDFEDLWTTAGIEGLIADAALPFLCEYRLPRAQLAAGGVLGVQMLDEVAVGVQDAETSLRRWQRLMDPLEPEAPGTWRPGGTDAAAIRVHESPIDGVAGITLKVDDVEHARETLKALKLLGPSRKHGCGLRHPEVLGLDVWFTR